MRKQLSTIFILVMFLLWCTLASAATITGKVTGVIDGDTFKIDGVKIRLYGIDTPEKGQVYEPVSTRMLSTKILNKNVRVEIVGVGAYGRIIGKVYADGLYINLWLVKKGCAWWYQEYAKNDVQLMRAEAEARQNKLGLWAIGEPIPPWEWRERNK